MAQQLKSCFVISPIGEEDTSIRKRADQVLNHIIRPAASECGYTPFRADEIDKPGIITTQVLQHIVDDDLVIADLTGMNPNVFYELAIRHVIRKPYIHMIVKGEKIPFDVAASRAIFYDPTDLDSAAEAKASIVKQIKETEKDPNNIESPVSVSVDLQRLKQSEDPEERSLGDMISLMTDISMRLSKIESGVVQEEDRFSLSEVLSMLHRIQRRLYQDEEDDASVRTYWFNPSKSFTNTISRAEAINNKVARLYYLAAIFDRRLPWANIMLIEMANSLSQENFDRFHNIRDSFKNLLMFEQYRLQTDGDSKRAHSLILMAEHLLPLIEAF
ncbi:MAG: hypothetical protein WD341_09415 [Tistlia sp.]|uniref:hypothetical protein n=1 Tax=Tistlia sp. TaxID=3057121 RepID=UPI0034A158BF